MSFLTQLLESVPHFGNAVEQSEEELKSNHLSGAERLKLLVHLAYCYAHVQLQKGVAAAAEAVALAETGNDLGMKGNALCARAMNEFRIGYVTKAQAIAREALSIFEKLNDEEGKCDAYFQLGSMPYINEGPGDTTRHLAEALTRYTSLGDTTGVYLVRIQQSIQLFFATRFDEGIHETKSLVAELSAPHQRHLLCFTYMQVSIGMHIKQDVVQFGNYLLEWQKIAEANGNFHDYTMTKAMLPDCYRLQHLDKEVMRGGLEAIECTDKLGSMHGHSTSSIVMGHICIAQGQYADAIGYYSKAMIAAREIEDTYKSLMALNCIGEVYLKSGQITEARHTFEMARREATHINDRLNLIAANRHLAELAYQQGEFDQALFDFKMLFETSGTSDGWNIQDYGNYASCIARASELALLKVGLKPGDRNSLRFHYLNKYIELAQAQQSKREEANACNALAEYYEETSDLKQSIRYRKKYIQLYEQVVNEQSNKNMMDLRMYYESEKKEREIVLLKKEGEQALLNERLRISRELHDEVGATLSGIAMYSHLAKEQIKNAGNTEVEKSLNIMQQSSGEMVNKLNDIVWLINPEQDTLKKLVERLEEYAVQMAAIKNIKVKVNVPENLEEMSLSVESRRNIYLFCKEAINNAVKYSNGTILELKIREINTILEFSVSDNGKGFNEAMVRRGNGLENMQKRADSIGAKLIVQSKQSEGTLLSMQLKMTGRREE